MNFAAAIGGFGPGLGAHIGVGVANPKAGTLQRHTLVAGLVLVDLQRTGFGVVDKANLHDVDCFVGRHRDRLGRAVLHIAGRSGDLGDSNIHLGLPLRDWDDNGFAAVGHIHRIVDIPVTLHLEDGSAQW